MMMMTTTTMTSMCGCFIVPDLEGSTESGRKTVGWRVTSTSNKHEGMCHYISVNGVVYFDYVVYRFQDRRW